MLGGWQKSLAKSCHSVLCTSPNLFVLKHSDKVAAVLDKITEPNVLDLSFATESSVQAQTGDLRGSQHGLSLDTFDFSGIVKIKRPKC